jgi:hypothetical protein
MGPILAVIGMFVAIGAMVQRFGPTRRDDEVEPR